MSKFVRLKNFLFYKCNIKMGISPDFNYLEFAFRELTEKDFLRNRVFQEKSRKERYIDYLKQQHKCVGFFNIKDEVVCYIWISYPGTYPPLHRNLVLSVGKNVAYIWDCRTLPQYYRLGLYKEGLKRVIYMLSQQNLSEIRICNLSNNIAATKSMESLKNEFLYNIYVLDIFSINFIFRTKKFLAKISTQKTIIDLI